MEIFVKSELKNVASRFHRAMWRNYDVMRTYPSAVEASKFHNLANCCYEHRAGGVTLAAFDNARIDRYGRRYR